MKEVEVILVTFYLTGNEVSCSSGECTTSATTSSVAPETTTAEPGMDSGVTSKNSFSGLGITPTDDTALHTTTVFDYSLTNTDNIVNTSRTYDTNILIVTDNTSAGYHGITEDSYTATPSIRNTHGNFVYNASEGFGYTSMGSNLRTTTDSYNYNGTQRSESGNSSNKAEAYNITSSYYYNMSHTNASSINSYAIGNGTHVAYFDCPPVLIAGERTFLLPHSHKL